MGIRAPVGLVKSGTKAGRQTLMQARLGACAGPQALAGRALRGVCQKHTKSIPADAGRSVLNARPAALPAYGWRLRLAPTPGSLGRHGQGCGGWAGNASFAT